MKLTLLLVSYLDDFITTYQLSGLDIASTMIGRHVADNEFDHGTQTGRQQGASAVGYTRAPALGHRRHAGSSSCR
jgi:hypothetical protein